MMDPNCSFCSELMGEETNNFFEMYVKEQFRKEGLKDRIVAETNNFVVMPMIGPLVPGYLLLLPKQHYSSYAKVPEELIEEAIIVKEAIRDIFKTHYGNAVVFEHGALNKMKKGACCSDHAHLHIVAVDVDVLKEFPQYGFIMRKVNSLMCVKEQIERNVPYLFYENQEGVAVLMDAPVVEAQFIRKLLATRIGAAERSYWNKNMQIEWMIDIIKTLKMEIMKKGLGVE